MKDGIAFRIEYVDDKMVKSERLEHAFTYEDVRDMFRLAVASTYHYCQGCEFGEPLTLHELAREKFTLRRLFVGLSRAKRIDVTHSAA